MNKSGLTIIVVLFVCTIRLNAQFAAGTQMFGPSFGVTYSNQNEANYSDPLVKIDEIKQFNEQYTINLQYGYFKKENVMISFGLNYSYRQNKLENTETDTIYSYYYTSSHVMNYSVGMYGNVYHYFPVKTRYGFYHTEGINLSYGYSKANSSDQARIDSPLVISASVPSNSLTVILSISAGAYYKISEHFLLQTELSIFSLGMGYSWRHGNDYVNGPVNNRTIDISTSGTLTPNFNFSNLSIGIRYIIPPKKIKQ